MGETETLLRDMLAEMREQNTHLRDIKTTLSSVATSDELNALENRVCAEVAKSNGMKDKILYIQTVALIALAGATVALKYAG